MPSRLSAIFTALFPDKDESNSVRNSFTGSITDAKHETLDRRHRYRDDGEDEAQGMHQAEAVAWAKSHSCRKESGKKGEMENGGMEEKRRSKGVWIVRYENTESGSETRSEKE